MSTHLHRNIFGQAFGSGPESKNCCYCQIHVFIGLWGSVVVFGNGGQDKQTFGAELKFSATGPKTGPHPVQMALRGG